MPANSAFLQNWLEPLLGGWLYADSPMWTVIGFMGAAIFGSRFILQWLASEKAGRSVMPLSFWFLSIAGGLMTLVYGLVRREPVIIFGQALSTGIYLRNVALILKEKRRKSGADAVP